MVGVAVASPPQTAAPNFTRFAWGVLGWNMGVVLWGAYVRASGSGAGCGNHWPLCNGEVVPHAPQVQTLIEFTHRAMSGIAFAAVAMLLVWSLRAFPRAHRARRMAMASFAFLIVEALLGAGLVLFDYVGANNSVGRALYLSLHLANTLLLLAALTLTAWFSRETEPVRGRMPRFAVAALAVALLVSITGGIAALGDTLFPAVSLGEAIRQDFSGTAHFLLRLRVFHPVLAVGGGVFFAAVAIWMMRSNPTTQLRRIALGVVALTIVQLSAGAINLVLLAPVWMQIVHLLMADLVWISLVLMAVESRGVGAAA
jgi:cytochrome c oxidase assembly protein subunit 15